MLRERARQSVQSLDFDILLHLELTVLVDRLLLLEYHPILFFDHRLRLELDLKHI